MIFREMVKEEMASCYRKRYSFTSFHYGYAVLLEQVEEFWDEVKKKERKRDRHNMLKELVQIASICERMAEDLLQDQLNHPQEVS